MRDTLVELAAKDKLLRYIKKGQVSPKIDSVKRCMALNLDREEFGRRSNLICCRNGTVAITPKLFVTETKQLRY